MKFVLTEPPEWSQRTVDIRAEKLNGDSTLEVFHGDSGEKLLEFEIESKTRNLVLKSAGSPRLVIQDEQGNLKVVGQAGTARKARTDEPDNLPRNWEIVDGEDADEGRKMFKVWLDNGAEITVPMAEPGPLTPQEEIFEIIGQPEMLFTMVLALKLNKHSLLTGPTGLGKTSMYRWLAQRLGYNLVIAPIARGTQDRHLVGEYAPAGPGDFRWMDGPVTVAARMSREHPTMLVFDELNRIGNIAEFSRIYQLIDDTRMLELPEKRVEGHVEVIKAGELFVGATSNPSDDEGADYIGVKELDPAFVSRFPIQPRLDYPDLDTERKALMRRVGDVDASTAGKMCEAAKRVRESANVRFPLSFRELEAWARLVPYFGYDKAAEVAVISKSPAVFREDIRNLLKLQGFQSAA